MCDPEEAACAETVEDALNQRWTSRPVERADSKHGSTFSSLSLKSDRSRFNPPCFSSERPDTHEDNRAPQQKQNMLKDFELKSEGLLKQPAQPRDVSDQTFYCSDEAEAMRSMNHQEDGRRLEQSDDGPLGLLQRKLKLSLKQKYKPLTEGLRVCLREGLSLDLTKQKSISCSDLFRSSPGRCASVRTVLTTGSAGVGKSVLVQRSIVDWCEDRALTHVQLLCPLSFPQLNLLQQQSWTLMELLQTLCPELRESGITELRHYRLLFILDGLDECRLPLDFSTKNRCCDSEAPMSVDVLLTNLMLGNLLPEAQLWITSRPMAARSIPPTLIHRVTEVRGFDDHQKEAYFLQNVQDEGLARTVLANIRSSAALHSMCHLPLFCSTTASACDHSSSTTQVFLHFLSYHMMNMRHKYGVQRSTVSTVIRCLSRVAHEQLQRGQLLFSEDHVRGCGLPETEALLYSGLCTQVFTEDLCGGHWAFSFVHLSLQEFLAALFVHLSICGDEDNLHGVLRDHPLFLHFLQGLALEIPLCGLV